MVFIKHPRSVPKFFLLSYIKYLHESKYVRNLSKCGCFVSEPPITRFSGRRKSVFAETYNPEEDDDDDGTKVVFPKSDEQRQQLAEAVKNILLFRALDKEQMTDVLDAMFERKVQKDELVIKQGDDGDNFYVIQK